MRGCGLIRDAIIAGGMLLSLAFGTAQADQQSVIVTVNDQPITNYDVEQRLRLWQLVGHTKQDPTRKQALQSLIDDLIKISAAKKNGVEAKEDLINAHLERMAKGMQTDVKGLAAKLKKQGISINALKQYAAAQISFNRLLVALYKVDVSVDAAEVEKAYDKMTTDPRLKPVLVYQIMEIVLPVEKSDPSMQQQLLYARAVEAQTIMQRFKGCDSARASVEGIYNTQIKRPMEVDSSKIPPQLRQALDKAGPGRLVGPALQGSSVQLIALCGRQNMAPPKPSKQMVQQMLENKKFDSYEQRYMRDLRRTAYIDYKDPSYSQ
ncbi:MAG: SurA N-terminal domain-containing protein [Rhizobiales bacterium]|nr:SurA N-terminal domain-containing protein [Hyphomicrobiales bacterium]